MLQAKRRLVQAKQRCMAGMATSRRSGVRWRWSQYRCAPASPTSRGEWPTTAQPEIDIISNSLLESKLNLLPELIGIPTSYSFIHIGREFWQACNSSNTHRCAYSLTAGQYTRLRKQAMASTFNSPAPGVPFFTPLHHNSPGTPVKLTAETPTLFTPLKIRGATLRNRIVVAPMCQYSASHSGPDVGAFTPYHITTLGHYALKGASLVFTEATGVQPNGRISANCPGLWQDDQIPGLKAVCDMVRSQGALCGIQLAHAGRKSSTVPPYIAAQFRKGSVRATKDVGESTI